MREFLQQAAKEVFKDEDVWQKYVRSGEILFFYGLECWSLEKANICNLLI